MLPAEQIAKKWSRKPKIKWYCLSNRATGALIERVCQEERVHSLQIERQAHKTPFSSSVCQTTQRKLAKTKNFFDDVNDWLNGAFS
jgi:hypothetical protein